MVDSTINKLIQITRLSQADDEIASCLRNSGGAINQDLPSEGVYDVLSAIISIPKMKKIN